MDARISIRSPLGYDIPANLGTPDRLKPSATVIMSHGIFSEKTERGRFDRQASIHHRLGFRTVRFDYQGHGEHPIRPRQTSIAGIVSDTDTVFRYVSSTYGEPVLLVASSFGASAFLLYTLMPNAQMPERAVLLNPVTDYLTTFVEPREPDLAEAFNPSFWQRLLAEGSATPVPGFELSRTFGIELMTLRPDAAFDQLTVPTLVMHGTADRSVSFEVTRANSARSSAVTFEAIEGSDHAFAEPWAEDRTFTLIEHWLTASG